MTASKQTHSWTIAIYVGADNGLAAEVEATIEEIMASPRSSMVELFIQVDVGAEQENRMIHVPIGSDSPTVQTGIVDPQSGDVETIVRFLDWTASGSQTDHYALLIWDHGGGWKFALQDSKKNNLTNVELREALGRTKLKRKIDLLGFDACLMAAVEVAYQFRGLADWFVASEGLCRANSWPYTQLRQHLERGDDPAALAKAVVNHFPLKSLPTPGHGTLAAVELAKVERLVAALHALACGLIATDGPGHYPQGKPYRRLLEARRRMAGLGDADCVDLGSFLDELAKTGDFEQRLGAELQASRDAYREAVVALSAFGEEDRNKSGLSIFFPTVPEARRYFRGENGLPSAGRAPLYEALEFSKLEGGHGWTTVIRDALSCNVVERKLFVLGSPQQTNGSSQQAAITPELA